LLWLRSFPDVSGGKRLSMVANAASSEKPAKGNVSRENDSRLPHEFQVAGAAV
jgi:hypothetical protein